MSLVESLPRPPQQELSDDEQANDKAQQVAVMDDTVLDKEMDRLKVSDEFKPKIKQVFNKGTMNAQEVKDLMVKTNPCLQKVFDAFANSRFNKFELSSVGIAIAHANYRRRTGQTLDLSIWIN